MEFSNLAISIYAATVPLYVRTLQLRHGEYRAPTLPPVYLFSPLKPRVFAHCVPTTCPTIPRDQVCNADLHGKHHFPCLPYVSLPAPTQSSPLYTMHSTRLCWASTGSGKYSACSALAFENENFPVAMVPMLRSQINAMTILRTTRGPMLLL